MAPAQQEAIDQYGLKGANCGDMMPQDPDIKGDPEAVCADWIRFRDQYGREKFDKDRVIHPQKGMTLCAPDYVWNIDANFHGNFVHSPWQGRAIAILRAYGESSSGDAYAGGQEYLPAQ